MRPTPRQLISATSIGGRNRPIKRYRGELEKKVTVFEALNISKGSRMNRDSGLPVVVPTLVSFPNVNPQASTFLHLNRPNPTPEVPYSMTLSTLNHPLWNPPHPKEPFKRASTLSGEEEGQVETFARKFGGAEDLFAEGGETNWLEEEETEEMKIAKEKRKEKARLKDLAKQEAIKLAQAAAAKKKKK